MKKYQILFFIIFLSSVVFAQSEYDEIAFRINEVICSLLNIIFWVLGIVATLIIIYRGLNYVLVDNPEDRNEIKGKIIQALLALVVIVIAMPSVNYLIENTAILPFECGSGGYTHPGECGECPEGYFIYCCCDDESSIAFHAGRCPYGGGDPLPVSECLISYMDCSSMCQGRGYDDGVSGSGGCCCHMP